MHARIAGNRRRVGPRPPIGRDWGRLQFTTLLYYLHETNPDNGLVRDKTEPSAPASIAATGMAMAAIPVIVERGIIIREFAAKITLKRLRYLMQCPQGPEPDASGYKGFFITSWKSRLVAGSGNANCRRSILRSCSPAR